MTTLFPLALLPQVTIAKGRAQFPLSPGSAPEYGSPDEVIAAFVEQGAAWVHVVDTDAQAGDTSNYPALAKATGAHVQLAAGVSTEQTLQGALAAGPSRIVVDPADLTWLQNALGAHGGLLAVGLDIGTDTAFALQPTLDEAGCTRYVVHNGVHQHWRRDDRNLLAEFCEQTDSKVMASGGVSMLDDLHELHELVPNGLDGIILDTPLYDGSFMYAEAVAAGADRFDMFFWGPPDATSNW
jgi:phosphoribosylformimino-5-aminoimidazole carboxamide ribotide isomerase/phosphoribosylanthranilate isomerase